MSQEKVNKYKEEKKHRKETVAKKKKKAKLWKILTPLIVIVVIAILGLGIYYMPKLSATKANENIQSDIDMDELMNSINASVSGNTNIEVDDTTN